MTLSIMTRQCRWLSVPRSREIGAKQGRGNSKYVAYRTDRIRNECKGLQEMYLDDLMPEAKDGWTMAPEASPRTPDEYERFPWEQYSKTVTFLFFACVYGAAMTLTTLSYANSLYNVEHELSSTDGRIRLITTDYNRIKLEKSSLEAELAYYRKHYGDKNE